jgi:hypothetical protein
MIESFYLSNKDSEAHIMSRNKELTDISEEIYCKNKIKNYLT